MPEISKFSVVEKGAVLADDVQVGPFSYIGPHVTLDSGCVIDSHVTIVGHTRLGPRNSVLPLAVLGVAQQGPEGQLVIGEANTIREHVTLYSGKGHRTVLGSDNLIMVGCQVDAGATISDHIICVNNTHVGAGAVLEDYVRTSSFVNIHPGVRVGAYTFLLGYADIERNCPPFAMVQGSPLRVRGLNSENLRRCGFGEEEIRKLKLAFRELYNGTGEKASAAALRKLRQDRNPHLQRLVRALHEESGRSRA